MGKTTPKVTIRTPQTSKESFLWGFYYYYNPLNFNQLYLIGWRATRRKTLGGMGQAWGRHGAGEQPYRGLGRDLGQDIGWVYGYLTIWLTIWRGKGGKMGRSALRGLPLRRSRTGHPAALLWLAKAGAFQVASGPLKGRP